MDKLKEELTNTPKSQDCTVTLKEVETKIATLESECRHIISLPPPPPPKKEEPKPADNADKPAGEQPAGEQPAGEQPAGEQPAADAEMKDETGQQPAEESK